MPLRKKPLPKTQNLVRLSGRLSDIRQRWTPDGSLAVVASLQVERPHLGPQRANIVEEQPMPLRALGDVASMLVRLDNQMIAVEGTLRRRYYSRDGEQRWGQVEIWVDACHPQKD